MRLTNVAALLDFSVKPTTLHLPLLDAEMPDASVLVVFGMWERILKRM